MQAEAYLTLAARYETSLFSYAARMLGGLGDGERCCTSALALGWRDLEGSEVPSQQHTWLYTLVRESCFDELSRRAPGTTGEADLGRVEDCVALAADAALAAVRPAHRDVLILRDVHGLDTPDLCAVTDMGVADLEHLLYRARAEFAGAFAALPADPHCRAGREGAPCPDCAERERLRATPQYALLRLGPLPVRQRLRAELRRLLSSPGP
jgi:DNA-directed RNA polymerase specialized sigma24 family protein